MFTLFSYYRQLFPSGRAHITASASLQGIRGEGPQRNVIANHGVMKQSHPVMFHNEIAALPNGRSQ
jgi:hypothetical protein